VNLRTQTYLLLSHGTTYPVYGGIAPSTAVTPYIVFSLISDVPNYTHAGHDQTGTARVQASCYSTASYARAANVAEAVVTAMQSAPGTYGVDIAHKANELDLYEEASKTYHVPVDFRIWHTAFSNVARVAVPIATAAAGASAPVIAVTT
jgi:hypothetical protein